MASANERRRYHVTSSLTVLALVVLKDSEQYIESHFHFFLLFFNFEMENTLKILPVRKPGITHHGFKTMAADGLVTQGTRELYYFYDLRLNNNENKANLRDLIAATSLVILLKIGFKSSIFRSM